MAEPSHIVYEVENSDLDFALAELRALVLPQTSQDDGITVKCKTQRIAHIFAIDQALSNTVRDVIVCYVVPHLANSQGRRIRFWRSPTMRRHTGGTPLWPSDAYAHCSGVTLQ